MKKKADYVKPNNAGLASESRAVGRRIAKLLDACSDINRWVVEGAIENDCWNFRCQLKEKLEKSGWRVSLNARERFVVLPPKEKRF